MSNRIEIHQYPLGPMDNFVYVLQDKASKDLMIVDPAWDWGFLKSQIQQLSGTLVGVLLTHGHHDHVNALDDVLSDYDVPVYISEAELPGLTPDVSELKKLKDGDSLYLGETEIQVIHTPGHTPGGQCFLIGKQLIAGDTLFINGCGRADLGGSDPESLYDSLEKLKTLDDAVIVYPGHDYGDRPRDSLGRQKQENPYLNAGSKEAFLRKRMGFSGSR